MSCQAGMWNVDGKPIDREFLGKLGASIDQYGPDQADEWGRGGPGEYVQDNVAMIYRPFHTNKESRLERQPYVTYHGETGAVRNVMTWDGRLDNRDELIRALSYELETNHRGQRGDSRQVTVNSATSPTGRLEGSGHGSQVTGHWTYTDVAIVMAAWEAWGTDCFRRLIGDFSLSVWSPDSRTLTLAKDFVGIRYLYYEIFPEGAQNVTLRREEGAGVEPPGGPGVWWCSRLEPLILLSGRQYQLNEEYIAGFFASHAATRLTPYMGVHAVPAGHFAQIRNGNHSLTEYWNFDPQKHIRYKTDSAYEEHFRHVFFQSVERRLRADSPIVAGLSGGRDSSAIVCVADALIARGEVQARRLDTYSRYDEEEPFGNDKPFLTIVEQKRGRAGHHFPIRTPKETATQGPSPFFRRLRSLTEDSFSAHPGQYGDAEGIQKRMDFMKANGYRIILTGIGGDEVTGGVPYSISELADLLVTVHFIHFAKQLKAWSLAQKRPTLHLLLRVLSRVGFLGGMSSEQHELWPWINERFISLNRKAFLQMTKSREAGSGLPSFRTNISVLAGVSSQLAHLPKVFRKNGKENHYDRGFPFLDRDFLEFMFAIPRGQVLRPRQHRSLMRRALAGIVPQEILDRTRKSFAIRNPALGIQSIAPGLRQLFADSQAGNLGYLNPIRFLREVEDVIAGRSNLIRPIERTILLEVWLRTLVERGIVVGTSLGCRVGDKPQLQIVA